MGIDITLKRIEKKRRILEFIESKKIVQRKETKKREVLIQVDKRVQVPYVKKEETPKEYQKVYMADSKMRKQRKEKAVRSFSLSKDKDKLKNKVFLNGGTNENVSKMEKKTSRQKVKSEQSAVEKERLVSSRLKKKKEAKQAKLDETRKQREEIQRQKEARLVEEKRIKEEKLRQRQENILKEKEAKQAKLDKIRKQKEEVQRQKEARLAEEKRIKEEKLHQRQDNKTKLIGFIASVQKNRKLIQQEKFLEKAALIADKKLQQKQTKQAGLDKKKELADLRLKRREATRIDSEQALKQKEALLAEKKRVKEEELRQKQELILKEKEAKQVKLDETRKQKEEVKQQEILELADKEVLKQKEEKLSVVYKKGEIFSKNLLTKREGERRRLLSRLLNDKEVYRKRVASPDTKIEIEKPSKKPVTKLPVSAVSKEKQKEVNIRLAELQKESAKISRASLLLTKESVLALKKFIPTLRKKKKEILSKQALAKTRPVAEQRKEPFQLVPFVRKNAFKIVFVLLLIVWLLEMFLFSRGARDATARLKFITGEEPYQQKKLTKQRFDKSMDEETALVEQIFVAGEKIDIEGKRDPFSPGRLTMEVLERPTLTNIVLASKPEVISILRAPKTVSILREEKPIEPPKSVDLPKTEPPKITPVSVAKLSEVPQPLKTTPLEKVSAPKVTPLIVPEMRCDLIFRGKMLFEGVEYLFIEGRQKTYRVTIGDIVEGFRILRKEKDRLYLSKDGISYEIKID